MKKLRRLLRFSLLLNKRLLKRPSFLAVLLIIPLISLLIVAMSAGDSGIVKIALAKSSPKSVVAEDFIEELKSGEGLIQYELFESPDKARGALVRGEVDGAWIFPDDSKENYVVEVLEREETVLLRLSREKLCSVVYSESSKNLYINFIRKNVQELKELSDEKLIAFYEKGAGGDYEDLFEFSSVKENKIEENRYLEAPVRGMLAVLVIFAGLSVACVYIIDDKKGLFLYFGPKRKVSTAIFYQVVSMIPVSAVALFSVFVSNLSVFAPRENLLMFLLQIAAAGFCLVIRVILKKLEIFGALLPLIVIVLLALSPVFLDFNGAFSITRLLPTYYYINAVYNDAFILPLAIYGVSALAIYAILAKTLRRN